MKGSLRERQATLQQRLQHNRGQIGLLLQPVDPVALNPPRSLTMLFFRHHPGLATRLLGQGAALLVGGRLLRYFTAALLMGRTGRGLTVDRRG
jgi:hypothetical protein